MVYICIALHLGYNICDISTIRINTRYLLNISTVSANLHGILPSDIGPRHPTFRTLCVAYTTKAYYDYNP